MTEGESESTRPTFVIFLDFFERLIKQDPLRAKKLEYELQCHFGKPSKDHGLPLVKVIAQQIESRVSSKSAGDSCTPESYIADLFSPDPNDQQVNVSKIMKGLIPG
jgi:hypothetical protein